MDGVRERDEARSRLEEFLYGHVQGNETAADAEPIKHNRDNEPMETEEAAKKAKIEDSPPDLLAP